MKQEFSDRDISSTFARGMTVLRAFDDNHTRLTLADIARKTNLDRATVRRLALTLVHLGYAYRDGKHFTLSPKVLTLAGSFLRGNQFGTLVQPLLNRYAASIESTVSLAIVDSEAAVYVAQSTLQTSDITFGFTVGSKLPLLHSAIGRALLSVEESGWVAELIGNITFERYTAETTMNRRELKKKIAECKAQGHAIVCNEFESNVTGIAVPVNNVGEMKAAVGTSRRSAEVKSARKRKHVVGQLTQLAQELGRSEIFASGNSG